LYSSPNIIRVTKLRGMRWTDHWHGMEEVITSFSIVGGKPEGKRPFIRPRRRLEDNIKMDFKNIECEDDD